MELHLAPYSTVVSSLSSKPNTKLYCIFPGFLKNRKKKDRKKSIKSKDSLEAERETEQKDIGSDGEERGRSETPTPDQNDDEGFRNSRGSHQHQPPSSSSNNNNSNDPWADFNQPEKKSFYSSSDSDSDDEEVKKIRVNIRPIEAVAGAARSATSASVDELQRAVGGIDLNVATLPVREFCQIKQFSVKSILDRLYTYFWFKLKNKLLIPLIVRPKDAQSLS